MDNKRSFFSCGANPVYLNNIQSQKAKGGAKRRLLLFGFDFFPTLGLKTQEIDGAGTVYFLTGKGVAIE